MLNDKKKIRIVLNGYWVVQKKHLSWESHIEEKGEERIDGVWGSIDGGGEEERREKKSMIKLEYLYKETNLCQLKFS